MTKQDRGVSLSAVPFISRMAETEEVDERLAELIVSLSHRLVVIGSVARGKRHPKDIDLLYDSDSERAESEIRTAVRASGLPFDSCLPGNWCFDLGGTALEILPIHRGPRYRTVRKRASLGTVAGMLLLVARAEDAVA